GRWLRRQKQPATWKQLTTEQQERLSTLGVKPAKRPAPAPAANSTGKASTAFQHGLQALTQWIQREGTQKAVPRGHSEAIVIDGQEHQHKLGVWISNTRARRDKLTPDQLNALRKLGMDWA